MWQPHGGLLLLDVGVAENGGGGIEGEEAAPEGGKFFGIAPGGGVDIKWYRRFDALDGGGLGEANAIEAVLGLSRNKSPWRLLGKIVPPSSNRDLKPNCMKIKTLAKAMPPKATANRTFWWESCDQARVFSGISRSRMERIVFPVGWATRNPTEQGVGRQSVAPDCHSLTNPDRLAKSARVTAIRDFGHGDRVTRLVMLNKR
jgi:hypothetical protein